jgi:hypothetical protein
LSTRYADAARVAPLIVTEEMRPTSVGKNTSEIDEQEQSVGPAHPHALYQEPPCVYGEKEPESETGAVNHVVLPQRAAQGRTVIGQRETRYPVRADRVDQARASERSFTAGTRRSISSSLYAHPQSVPLG